MCGADCRSLKIEKNISSEHSPHRCYIPVAGNPTIIITSLSLAVVPITSRGAAFSPSGNRCGVGLSTTNGGVLSSVVDVVLNELRLFIGSECAVDAGALGILGENVMM